MTGRAIPQIEPRREIAPEVVKALPGAGEDVLQTLSALPGVVSADDWSSRLYVRGGRPDQNGIFLDGIPIHDPYRLFGLTSLFNPDAVGAIEFYPGGFDVRYGDRLSAVVAVENRDGRRDRAIAGAASVALTHTNLVAEGRILESTPSSYLVSARRTYYDLAMKASSEEDSSSSYPSFLDLRGIRDLELDPERAEHRLVGASWLLERGFKIGVDLYDKRLDDILQSGEYTECILVLDEDDQVAQVSRDRLSYLPDNARSGYARGAELTFTILEKPSRRYYGMVAYSWGEARTRDDEGWRFEPWDRTHTVTLIGGWRFSERWELGLRWRYASGFPTTPVTRVLRVTF